MIIIGIINQTNCSREREKEDSVVLMIYFTLIKGVVGENLIKGMVGENLMNENEQVGGDIVQKGIHIYI